MFSREPRAAEHYWEIIYPGEAFTWQEAPSAAEGRRQRKRRVLATCVGLTLALLVLGNAFGISWLFSAVAGGETAGTHPR
jgi:hypothetical protein